MALRVEYAGQLRELGRTDETAANQANQQYAGILQEDPTNKDALATVLKRNVEFVEFYARSSDFTALKDTADKVLKISEKDPRYQTPKDHQDLLDLRRSAQAYEYIAVVAAWLQNIVTPTPVLEENLKGLDDMLKIDIAANDPERINPDVPYYLCMGYWKQAELRTNAWHRRVQGACGEEGKAGIRHIRSGTAAGSGQSGDVRALSIRFCAS